LVWFEHPMLAQQKHLETTESAGPSLKHSKSMPFMNTKDEKQLTMLGTRKHTLQESRWIVVHFFFNIALRKKRNKYMVAHATTGENKSLLSIQHRPS
jgi:hypothetical protein